MENKLHQTFCNPIKKAGVLKLLFALIPLFATSNILAQKDAIFKKDHTEIRCKILKETSRKYKYIIVTTNNKTAKQCILKKEVDSIRYNKYETNLAQNKALQAIEKNNAETDTVISPFQFTVGIGLNMDNILEFNSNNGPDKKSFSATSALDLGLNYYKEGNRFAMTNELHWTLSVRKPELDKDSYFQRVTDELTTLHDFSYAMSKNNSWNFNLITKINTSVFTIYDGNYFKDYNNSGKIQAFLNPYEVTFSPGIKYQPNNFFRLSISPYSFSLYGLTDQKIANTGYYTETYNSNNDYALFVFKKLGADVNIWYDRKFKKWLTMQYRLGFSSDYYTNFLKNGLMDGLFITKFKILKNISLTHRGILKGDFSSKPFKPYYLQTIMLSFTKTF